MAHQDEISAAAKFGNNFMQNEGGISGPAQNQDFYKQPSLMSKSKSMIIPQTTPNVSSGILSSFKDLMGIRKHDPPEISVSEPLLKSGHHEYKVKGRDYIGEFEVNRRFREFDTFRKVLYSRFLGLYVPPIPPKKSVGKTEDLLVEERLFFLDRFMRQIAELPYLYESDELQTFLRP